MTQRISTSLKRRIAVTTGSRSEYGILRPVLKEIMKSKKLKLYLIVTGTHLSKKYGYTIKEILHDGFQIYAKVPMLPQRDTNYHMSKAVGQGIIEFSDVFKKLKPDINLILGDRDEMLASSIAACHMNIPNAHIHGGDKSKGGIDEYNRHAITKISNIHFAATKKSMNRIIKMGENKNYVFFTGSPSIDEIIGEKISNKSQLEKTYGIKFNGNEIILLQHPVTTQTPKTQKQIKSTLDAVVKLKKETITIAPNSDSGNFLIFDILEKYAKQYPFIKFFKSIPRRDFLGMLKYSGVLVGNSSSGIIEGSYFKTPIVNIGIRQENREGGSNLINVKNFNSQSIFHAIEKALRWKKKKHFKNLKIYGTGNASRKIVRHLEKITSNDTLIQKQIVY